MQLVYTEPDSDNDDGCQFLLDKEDETVGYDKGGRATFCILLVPNPLQFLKVILPFIL